MKMQNTTSTNSASPLKKFKNRLIIGIVSTSFLLILFIKIAAFLPSEELHKFDLLIGSLIRSAHSPIFLKLSLFFTSLGAADTQIVLLLVIGAYLLFYLKHTWEWIVLTINLIGAWGLNTVLKHLFQRPRPIAQPLIEIGGYSFPSGHAMVALAFYGLLGYLLWLNLRDRKRPSWYVPLSTTFIILAIGISRIYLGVHFASDVIAGFSAGGIWLIACTAALHGIRYYKSKK